RSSGETARSLYYRKLNQKGTEWVRALAGPTILGLEIEKSLGGVLPSVAADAQIGLFLVAPEALDRAEPAAIFADRRARLRGLHFLIGAGLQELADPQAASVARRALGRQRVVGADHLVPIGDVGLGPEKQRAVILQ